MVFDSGDGKSNDSLFINECHKGMRIIRLNDLLKVI
jgi:hypothetical protein